MKSAGRTFRWKKQSISTGRVVSDFACVAAGAGGLAEAVVIAPVSRAPAARVAAVPTSDPRMAAPTVVLCPTAFT
ncbi:hypothetical protein GCM10010260_35730 [Streptomyces filipinensis]|uniref:Uncharacterized protein n=1 Tax=Streptomyces filipinensis TaxID=66887 RepID=A0A918IC96_9ACTN|nr:hypothetical protein GCM10010260_35730 [Streptomyces filipinensis]